MLTAQENALLTQVGPGTAGGDLLRRYWHPIAAAQEINDEHPTKFVRVLGEDLVIFLDKSERFGLIADKCAHRSASMVYGRVEERGISCAYHGWLYDCDGRILETPPERNDAIMKSVTIKGLQGHELHRVDLGLHGPRAGARVHALRHIGPDRMATARWWYIRCWIAIGCRRWRTPWTRHTCRSYTRSSTAEANASR